MDPRLQRNEILCRGGPGRASWGSIISIALALHGILVLGAICASCWAAEAQLLHHRGAPNRRHYGAERPDRQSRCRCRARTSCSSTTSPR